MAILRDLLSELSLCEKLWLLARIYWRKTIESRPVGAVAIFCGAVYEWLFCQKSPSKIMSEMDTEITVERWLNGETNILPAEVEPEYPLTVVCHCEQCSNHFTTKEPPFRCPKCGRYCSTDHILDHDGNIVWVNNNYPKPETPADYGMVSTVLYDSKNFPQERKAWEEEIVRLIRTRIKSKIIPVYCTRTDLDFWFNQDYKPTAVVQMIIERGRTYNPAAYSTARVPASTYYFTYDDQYIEGWK